MTTDNASLQVKILQSNIKILEDFLFSAPLDFKDKELLDENKIKLENEKVKLEKYKETHPECFV